MNILSLMSGSSLDGVDIGIIALERKSGNLTWTILNAETIEYPSFWMHKLKNASKYKTKELKVLDIQYAEYNAGLILKYCEGIDHQIDAISFHGHTLFHEPKNGYTFQLGCCATLASLTSLRVIGDFRSSDIALGGQGAPLMAIVDEYLFSNYSINLNLGGICNLSINKPDKFCAYDIAPCNQLLNYLAESINLKYDKDGQIAASGTLNTKFFKYLQSDPFYKMDFPKSLDNNYIRLEILSQIENFKASVNDKMFTACYFIAFQLTEDLKELREKGFLDEQNSKMFITGGGAHNKVLIELINSMCLNINVEPVIPERELIEYKELLLMGLLGFLRLNKQINVLSKYTGASKDTISGCIYEG